MYSRCPHCHTWQSVNVAQLRLGRGLLICSNCAENFDALVSLSDKTETEATPHDESFDGFLPMSGAKKSRISVWCIGLVLGFLILLMQIGYFEGDRLMRQPELLKASYALCKRLNCRLPTYKNLEDYSVLQSDLRTITDKNLVLSAVIIKKSAWSQVLPDIKLVLLDLYGQALAQRIFSAREYLVSEVAPADEVQEISLSIVPPVGVKIGGYIIALL